MSHKRKNQKPDKSLTIQPCLATAEKKQSPDSNGGGKKFSITPHSFQTLQNLSIERKFDIFIFVILLAFGIYQSIIYWGHQPVPHFDFHCFAGVGREILSLQMPSDYKRVPLTGMLQVLFGKITGGGYPELQGGWLLNSVSHTLTVIFLWLTARKLIGLHAVWFAIIAIINPFGLQLLTESIAETPMLFFVWVTFYLIFIRSKWAYLLASLATMVRYECAALIAGMFILDMIEGKNKKERVMSFVYAALASIPLALWMLGTILTSNVGGTHYLSIFSKDYINQFTGGADKSTGFIKNAKVLWETGFYPLLQSSPRASESFSSAVIIFTQVFVAIALFFGSIYGLIKKQWKILVLLIFFVPYFISHAKYPYPIHRYYATVFAIVMLIGIYGIISFWNLIKNKLPKPAVVIAQLLLFITAFIWTLNLCGYFPQLKPMSTASVSLPFVAILVTILALAANIFVYRKFIFTRIVVFSLMILIIVSNQFVIAGVVGNGTRDIEFKYLTDWYIQNAKPDEKLVTTVPIILTIMAPQFKDNFIHTNTFDANSPEEFIRQCYERNITYVAWDSRVGLIPSNFYYKSWKMENIAPLAAARDIGPYKFITQFRVNQRSYINLYRLRPLSELIK
ncbi:MAG: hypothetical protein A2Y10_18995 [Planctomycetes bacterium GWF2_41_51]|nr:MAG: hypothetical protein A2Y10_18995 [Planctomycetes bacterium GWF2_41_51]HBG27392.1 hypothetical protein [Phycisphaerales bacterium]